MRVSEMAVIKHSRQREAIKANLMQRCDHPTADMIYEDIRQEYPNISLGTVYRNLSLLTDLGEIRKITMDSGADHYDGNLDPHIHFFCRACGAILDLAPVDSEKLEKNTAESFDGVIEETIVTFSGLCGWCAKEAGIR